MNPNMLMGLVAVLAVANLGLVATTTMVVNDAASDEDTSTTAPDVQPDPIGNAAAIYVKFDGIDGESKDENHDKWIDVLSWSHDRGTRRDNLGSSGMDGVASTSIVLTKELDKASPKLAEMLSSGGTADVEFEIYSLVEYDDNNDLVLRKRPGRKVQSGMLINASIMHQTTMPVVLLPEAEGTDQSHMTTPGHKYIDTTYSVMGEKISLSYEKITWTYDTGGKEHEDDWVSPRVLAGNDLGSPWLTADVSGDYELSSQFNTSLTFDTPGRGPGDIPHKTEINTIGLMLSIHQPGGSATGQSRRRGVHQPGGSATGATRRRGDVIMEDVILVKELDKASPKLAEALANGEPLENATIVLRERGSGGGGGSVYLKIELEEAIVSSYSSGSGSTRAPDWRVEIEFPDRTAASGGFDTEMVSLSFHMANITYPGAGPNGTDMVISADPMLPRDGRVFTSTFLMIEGFEGDVEIEGREGTVQLHELGHAMGDPHTRWDPLVLDLSSSSVSFTKYIDKASPLLMQRMNDGGTLNATIYVDEYRTHPNGTVERVEYMKYELKNVMVTSVSTGGSGGEDKLTENVSLNFEEVKTTYVEMKESVTYLAGDPREDQYAVDMFLDIPGEGFSGEATARGHKDEIDVLAWSWGMSQSGTFHVGGGGGAGKANFQDISFTKYVDKSSPALMETWVNGETIGNGTFYIQRRGSDNAIVETEMISMQIVSIEPVSVVPETPGVGDTVRMSSGQVGIGHPRYATGVAMETITVKMQRVELAIAPPGGGDPTELTFDIEVEPVTLDTEITIQFEGLRGFDPDPDNNCVIVSYDHRVRVPTDDHSGKLTGVRQHSPFHVVMENDPASPYLRQALADGSEFNATISIDRVSSDGTRTTYYQYELKKARVTSYSTSGANGEALPSEQFSLSYESLTYNYVLQGIKEDDPGDTTTPTLRAAYAKFDGIDGESKDDKHVKWIDVLSVDWGISVSRDAASGLPTGKRQHKPITITKPLDKASPKLQEALAGGEGSDVTIEMFETDVNGSWMHTLTLNLTDAKVTSLDHHGHVTVLKHAEYNGHVTVLKAAGDGHKHHGHVTVLKSHGGGVVETPLEETQLVYSELEVYYPQTGDHFFDIWTEPEPLRAGFIKLGDIKGEATDADHSEWIEVLDYEHSLTRDFVGVDLRENETEGRLLHTPFIFTKVWDSSSRSIMDTYLNGSLIGVTMDVSRPMAAGATGATRTAVTVTFENASIESYELDYLDDDDDGDGVPIETISLRYSHVEWKVEEGESLRSEWYDPSMAPNTRASFIKFDGIDGESKDIDHDGWSDIAMVRYSVSEEIEGATGLPTGHTVVSSLVFTKPVDISSPFLLMSVARGDTYDVTIERYQPDPTAADGRVHYLTIELENASVERAESIDDDCDNDCDDTWDDMEEISLRFESIKWTWELLGIEHEDIG